MRDYSPSSPSDPTRRDFLLTTGGPAAAVLMAGWAPARANSAAGQSDSPAAIADGPNIAGAVPITLRINGKDRQLRVDPRTTLLDCIRETVALTGTKKGCDHGQCGACTVHVNGRRVNSCLSLAVMHDGEEITTIEGLGTPDALHPMQTVEFVRPADPATAVATAAQAKTAQQGADVRFVAGGTTLLDLMKLNVETPARLLDINRLPLDKIEATPDGGLKIGATARNSDLANHPTVERDYAVLSQALLSGATAQLRNMATTAGNLLQRTRCMYFRDTAMPCNKREPGSGCAAITGVNRGLAILGTSEQCIALNPSDMNVAMAALEATIHIQGPKGERSIPIADFHVLPGSMPQRDTVLEPGHLIPPVTLPTPAPGNRTPYLT